MQQKMLQNKCPNRDNLCRFEAKSLGDTHTHTTASVALEYLLQEKTHDHKNITSTKNSQLYLVFRCIKLPVYKTAVVQFNYCCIRTIFLLQNDFYYFYFTP